MVPCDHKIELMVEDPAVCWLHDMLYNPNVLENVLEIHCRASCM